MTTKKINLSSRRSRWTCPQLYITKTGELAKIPDREGVAMLPKS